MKPTLLIGALLWATPAAANASAAAAPALPSARTLAGQPFVAGERLTIVHYWATWCAPCLVEMPVLDAFYRRHHTQGVAMLAISIDQGASAGRLRQMTARYAFFVARIGDVRMARRDIPAALPVTRIYDRAGHLLFQTRGDGRSTLDSTTLERVTSPLLAGR
jgi:cytochrome c biogenesis protein CcmG/thiol:disulfide interchange protein DsbE